MAASTLLSAGNSPREVAAAKGYPRILSILILIGSCTLGYELNCQQSLILDAIGTLILLQVYIWKDIHGDCHTTESSSSR